MKASAGKVRCTVTTADRSTFEGLALLVNISGDEDVDFWCGRVEIAFERTAPQTFGQTAEIKFENGPTVKAICRHNYVDGDPPIVLYDFVLTPQPSQMLGLKWKSNPEPDAVKCVKSFCRVASGFSWEGGSEAILIEYREPRDSQSSSVPPLKMRFARFDPEPKGSRGTARFEHIKAGFKFSTIREPTDRDCFAEQFSSDAELETFAREPPPFGRLKPPPPGSKPL